MKVILKNNKIKRPRILHGVPGCQAFTKKLTATETISQYQRGHLKPAFIEIK